MIQCVKKKMAVDKMLYISRTISPNLTILGLFKSQSITLLGIKILI